MDRRVVKKIHDLIKDTLQNHHQGIGKPEPLKRTFVGFWSRRIDSEHRMVYRIDGKIPEIL